MILFKKAHIFLFLITNVLLLLFENIDIKDQLVISLVTSLLFAFFLSMIIVSILFSFAVLFLIIISTSINDMSAYFFGKHWGKRKLSPSISPNKTIEGFLAGISISLLFGFIWYFSLIMPDYSRDYIAIEVRTWEIIFIIFLVSFVSPFGDLFFSKIKRSYDKKDFGKLIPEHGGLLDRIDSHLFKMSLSVLILII